MRIEETLSNTPRVIHWTDKKIKNRILFKACAKLALKHWNLKGKTSSLLIIHKLEIDIILIWSLRLSNHDNPKHYILQGAKQPIKFHINHILHQYLACKISHTSLITVSIDAFSSLASNPFSPTACIQKSAKSTTVLQPNKISYLKTKTNAGNRKH